MKISVLTATYNRAEDLEKLYTSLLVNANANVDFEWLIMDDGSTDKTKLVIENFIKQKLIDIKYHYQKNQGKMVAINNLMDFVKGDIVFTCDSDDSLTSDCFELIKKYSPKLLEDDTVYALLFRKLTSSGRCSGKKFPEDLYRTDMFSLYFKQEQNGENILVFKADVRKKYKHELEADEKFVTESRLYHKMDLDYDIICINEPIEIGDYKKDGYTENYLRVYEEFPMGFYQYFKEVLQKNLAGVTFQKRMYIYKHYILFAVLSDADRPILNAKGLLNKLIISILWLPGKIKTKKMFKIKTLKTEGKEEENDNTWSKK